MVIDICHIGANYILGDPPNFRGAAKLTHSFVLWPSGLCL